MNISFRPHWPVLALSLVLASLSYILNFNGLYGQDAHEYLRQSRVLADRLNGLPAPPAGVGDAEIAGGYALAGALFQVLGVDALLALQLVSWLSAALALWMFELNLRVLSPGTRAESRWVYGILGLALAPYFVRAGLTAMSDALGLALALAALFFCLRAIELERYRGAVFFAVFAAWAVTVRYAMAGLLAVPALALALEGWRQRQFLWLAAAALAAGLAFLPLWWMKAGAPASPLGHSLLQQWSWWHFFQSTFLQATSPARYVLPNIIYLLYPLAHPGFCLTLPALFLLFKRTDVALYSKRLLLFSLPAYLLLLGGLALQNPRYLLPGYAILLLLFFPAWDRFFAYGLYFFKRLTQALMALTLACQLVFAVWILAPILARNHLEQTVATTLQATLPSGAELYGFDLDIALQSYLPEIRFHNLWQQRYDTFPPGAYLLFNEPALRDQWAGKNPMLNWEHARGNYDLEEIHSFPEGWTLYRFIQSK